MTESRFYDKRLTKEEFTTEFIRTAQEESNLESPGYNQLKGNKFFDNMIDHMFDLYEIIWDMEER